MAVTVTVVRQGATTTDSHVADVEATADGDLAATIPHGLGAAPQNVILTWLLAVARIKLWAATTIDATNVVLTGQGTAGGGAAGNQVRVIAERPHTLGR